VTKDEADQLLSRSAILREQIDSAPTLDERDRLAKMYQREIGLPLFLPVNDERPRP
jgi:hypothetical protein